jgi:hypothetical protein
MSSGNRFRAGKGDAMMKRLPMEDATRIVALAGGFDKDNGALKQISAYYFVLSERICIEEEDRLEMEAELGMNQIQI